MVGEYSEHAHPREGCSTWTAMSGRVESWGHGTLLGFSGSALWFYCTAGDASPAGVAAYSMIEREGWVSCMP